MATGLLALLDDVALIMDDLASAAKVATKKTSAILADDLAVNAQKASGYASEREIPVILKITKGSFINKLIILPSVFLLSYFAPSLIPVFLIIGGFYLSYEGTEKVVEFFLHRKSHGADAPKKPLSEREKVRSAIITDFILSLEIVIIALSSVQDKPFAVQVITVSAVAFGATVGIYGLVALIVKMDDFGLYLIEKYDGFLEKVGYFLVQALPKVIKALSVIGTVAMLTVGGGIFIHNIHALHVVGEKLPSPVGELVVGFVAGLLVMAVVKPILLLKERLFSGQE
ncbi:MAG: DUF808 domain-containing protein [Aquificae bacterium]|nr:DUF808 domain-containing protein [Aquificota bacterium]